MSSSAALAPNSRTAVELTNSMTPLRSTLMASGDISTSVR